MHLSKLWRGVAVASVACGLAATGAASASAAPATVTVTISAHSPIPAVTHDVFVQYANKSANTVTISGTVTGAASGEVAALYAQQFPFTKAPVQVADQPLTSTSSYSFTARPTLATKYTVEALPSATATTPDAVSAVQIVYVVTDQTGGAKKCSRPVCHETMKIYTHLPGSAYKTEAAKKWYFYFGLTLVKSGNPALPKWLSLDTHATISKVKKISSTEFERTITWSFRVGNDGYLFVPVFCSKDTESRDGLNLPGSHGCGSKRVRTTTALTYIG